AISGTAVAVATLGPEGPKTLEVPVVERPRSAGTVEDDGRVVRAAWAAADGAAGGPGAGGAAAAAAAGASRGRDERGAAGGPGGGLAQGSRPRRHPRAFDRPRRLRARRRSGAG